MATPIRSYFRLRDMLLVFAVSTVLFIAGIIGIIIVFPEYSLIHWFLFLSHFFGILSVVAGVITLFISYLLKITKSSALSFILYCTFVHSILTIIVFCFFTGFDSLKDIAIIIPVGINSVIGMVNGLILVHTLPKHA